MASLTNKVLQFVLNTELEQVPARVTHQAKRCLLDTLGALLAGGETRVARSVSSFAAKYFKGDEATTLVSGERVSSMGAALANGFACNALDIDDGYRLVKGHPGACLLPVLLAASETARRTTGSDFLTALIVGYEVAIRAGLIRHALYQTYHSSGSWGAIGGAAVAGRILGLNENTLRDALGTAEYHAPIGPMMKCIEKPSMVKDSIGWGNMVAMASVLLAQEGFTGIEPLFDEAPDEDWIEGLGREFLILNLYFKPYAACRWAQPAVAGALRVVEENELEPQHISHIRVRTFEAAGALSCAHPRNTEEAQYNLAYPVAAALVDGEVGPRQVLPPRIFDPTLLELADKVEVEVATEFEQAFPQRTYAEVVVHTEDDRELVSGPMQPPWEPPHNLPEDADLVEKFTGLAGPVLGVHKAREIVAMIWDLEDLDGIKPLITACIKGQDFEA
ncbi:MAG: MmgE/PrpD family protein [Deltaproteobacteria bacterium]|nr:MAG: MmgE/PrpD family protein [Deltaproteobacteria bacterium]